MGTPSPSRSCSPTEQMYPSLIHSAPPRGVLAPVARGWEQVSETQEDAASRVREGEIVGFETVAEQVTDELAYIVEIERYKAKVGGREDVVPIALRVTSILRPEDGGWKVVHRHADPITAPRPAQSLIQE